jgi:hypothetical protein
LIEEHKTSLEEDGPVTSIVMSREDRGGSKFKSVAEASAYSIEARLLVVLQVNCRSVYNRVIILGFS